MSVWLSSVGIILKKRDEDSGCNDTVVGLPFACAGVSIAWSVQHLQKCQRWWTWVLASSWNHYWHIGAALHRRLLLLQEAQPLSHTQLNQCSAWTAPKSNQPEYSRHEPALLGRPVLVPTKLQQTQSRSFKPLQPACESLHQQPYWAAKVLII